MKNSTPAPPHGRGRRHPHVIGTFGAHEHAPAVKSLLDGVLESNRIYLALQECY
jgi:hypothetical protein